MSSNSMMDDAIVLHSEKPWRIDERKTVRRRIADRLRRILLKSWFNLWRTLPGIMVYYFRPRKQVVLVVSSMRAGSTLLKALLAEAPDISHLPEIDSWAYRRCNRFAVYHQLYSFGTEKIVVLKRPGTPWVPLPAGFLRLKVLILVRDVSDVTASIARMTSEVPEIFPSPWTTSEAVDYWCEVYEHVLGNTRLWEHDVRFVRYEDLALDPEKITRDLLAFVGSVRQTGTRSYGTPDTSEWTWGSDDGGEKIRSMSVVPPTKHQLPGDDEFWRRVHRHPRVRRLRAKFGYDEEAAQTEQAEPSADRRSPDTSY